MAGTYNKFDCFVEDLAKKKHDLSLDTLKFALSDTLPTAGLATLSQITQITAQNGYTAGGAAATEVSCAQTSGTLKLVVSDTEFTASGGSFGPLRYVVLYNDSATGDPLIAWWDIGEEVTVADTQKFVCDSDQTNGILTIA